MSVDDIDRDLERALIEADLEPSSGFAQAVMASVYAEANAPAPIPFPWRRLLPAVVAGVIAFLAPVLLMFLRPPGAEASAPEISDSVNSLAAVATRPDVQLLAGGLVLTLAAIALPRRLFSSRF